MKKISKKLEPLYAFSAFGPNLLMIIVSVYLLNAVSSTGLSDNMTYAGKTIVVVGLFSVLVTVAKIIDGFIDIPIASATDNLKSKWGRRRPAILIGLIPMIITYVLLLFPISKNENSLINTIYLGVILILFFIAYTTSLVNYYATFSEITLDSRSRVRLSSWKAFFDTISYAIAYALIPLIVNFEVPIVKLALYMSPLLLTMLIPLFIIKEESNQNVDGKVNANSDDSTLKEKVKVTTKHRDFVVWVFVYGVFFFGLQMFLAGQNVLAESAMGLQGWQIAVMNSAAFAPVPIMLVIYNKVMKKRGFRFAFQSAILSFVFAMSFFAIAYVGIIDSQMIRLAIGATGATIGSYGIGAFFSSPYIITSQIAAQDQAKSGKSNASMFFAMQGLFNALVGAVSTGLIWLNLKEIKINGYQASGAHLMTFVVAFVCLISFFAAFKLRKTYQINEDEMKV